jgi:Lrp/AsnC family transcriptional regulator for asnA, asnC and gidA
VTKRDSGKATASSGKNGRGRPPTPRTTNGSGAPSTLDETDKAIIRELQVDGRVPYAKLGPAVGLSQAAVRQRVQRLIDSGAMQIVAVTDPLAVGFTVEAMVAINADGDLRAVADALAAIDEVTYVVITAGRFDIMAEVVCEGAEELLSLVNDQVRAVRGVTRAETFTYLHLAKQSYSWGTR